MAQRTATPTVSIAAKSVFKPVTHDVFVQYKAGKGAAVTISGAVSGATAGQVAELYAQTFPFKTAATAVPGQQLTLNPVGSTPIPYHFTAVPTLATKYTVKILPNSTSTTPVATSAPQSVYMVTNQAVFGFKPTCRRPVCHETIRIYTKIPASAYRTESGKRTYFYFGLKLSATGRPSNPKWMLLDKKAKISKPTRVSPTEFKITLSWSFRINNDGYSFVWAFCSKDSEAKDGINLPGSHGCGKAKLPTSISYIG